MASAEQHLAQWGITVDVAKQWILANINNLQIVYQAAQDFGISTDMLGDIVGVGNESGTMVANYFASNGIDTDTLTGDKATISITFFGADDPNEDFLKGKVEVFDDDGVIMTRQIDKNGDGNLDVFKYYEDGDGVITRKEVDKNFDGSIDRWKVYSDGVLVEMDRDTDYDGIKNDCNTVSIDGEIATVLRDKGCDGSIDFELTFDTNGSDWTLLTKKVDKDFDGNWDILKTFDSEKNIATKSISSDDNGSWDTYFTFEHNSDGTHIAHKDEGNDGSVDKIIHFDANWVKQSVYNDYDGDGYYEARTDFENGSQAYRYWDNDHDGSYTEDKDSFTWNNSLGLVHMTRDEGINGSIDRIFMLDPYASYSSSWGRIQQIRDYDGDGYYERTYTFWENQARAVKTQKIDSNGDGFYNILKTYDETGTELTSEAIETNESTLQALTFDMYA